MDQVHFIKVAVANGDSISKIAKTMDIDRKTVSKYANAPAVIAEPFPRHRKTGIDAYEPWIRDLLFANRSVTNPKGRLTAKRIFSLLAEGNEEMNLPACALSIRTVSRAVSLIRKELDLDRKKRYIKLTHLRGEAQLDFGEIDVFRKGQTCRQIILVLTLPFSNYRIARVLPAQNFECLAHGLISIFEELGRVPARIRCDNMSTAVSKVLKIDTKENFTDVWDSNDHPRKITEGFRQLMYAYHFRAEFCNTASGNEKGSVENAVGWFRRNFFVPAVAFDGNYKSLNSRLRKFYCNEAKKPHYRQTNRTIESLLQEEKAFMLELPATRFEACSWVTSVADNVSRISVDTNKYQVDAIPGEKLYIKKFWDRIEIYGENRDLRRTASRCYNNRKDFIDWTAEMRTLAEHPSAFKNSSLATCLSPACSSYLRSLQAPKRRLFLNAFRQMLDKKESFDDVRRKLEDAVAKFGQMTPEQAVNGFRGMDVVPTDEIAPMDIPGFMSCTLEPVRSAVYSLGDRHEIQ